MRYSPDLVQGFSRANSVCSQPAPELRAGKTSIRNVTDRQAADPDNPRSWSAYALGPVNTMEVDLHSVNRP